MSKTPLPKSPKPIEGKGTGGSCYHLMEWVNEVRFQVNSGDAVYLKDMREVRKIARWLTRYADSRTRKRDKEQGP